MRLESDPFSPVPEPLIRARERLSYAHDIIETTEMRPDLHAVVRVVYECARAVVIAIEDARRQ